MGRVEDRRRKRRMQKEGRGIETEERGEERQEK